MPRYFFHVGGLRPYHDGEGMELPDDAAAWAEAKRFARDIESTLRPGDEWRLEILRCRQPIYLLTITSRLL
jgi:hypothetical protein